MFNFIFSALFAVAFAAPTPRTATFTLTGELAVRASVLICNTLEDEEDMGCELGGVAEFETVKVQAQETYAYEDGVRRERASYYGIAGNWHSPTSHIFDVLVDAFAAQGAVRSGVTTTVYNGQRSELVSEQREFRASQFACSKKTQSCTVTADILD